MNTYYSTFKTDNSNDILFTSVNYQGSKIKIIGYWHSFCYRSANTHTSLTEEETEDEEEKIDEKQEKIKNEKEEKKKKKEKVENEEEEEAEDEEEK